MLQLVDNITSTSLLEDDFAGGKLSAGERSSTPQFDDSGKVEDIWDIREMSYQLFCKMYESTAGKKLKVRGLKTIPAEFLSGHFVKVKDEGNRRANTGDEKETFSWRRLLQVMRRAIINFLRKYFNIVLDGGNCCDNKGECSITCDCQKVKSLLNRTIRNY